MKRRQLLLAALGIPALTVLPPTKAAKPVLRDFRLFLNSRYYTDVKGVARRTVEDIELYDFDSHQWKQVRFLHLYGTDGSLRGWAKLEDLTAIIETTLS